MSAPNSKGSAVDGGGKGVVHNEGHAVGMGQPGVLLDVQHVEGGIGQRFAEYQLGVGTERGLDFLIGGAGLEEGHVDAQLPQGFIEKIEGAAVNGHAADDGRRCGQYCTPPA